jgi:putative alpha-1,2-mannosidase
MKVLSLIAVAAFAITSTFAQRMPADYVDPFIGTGGHGHTYPGATVPFGMVQLSPDAGKTGWDWCSSYHYSDTALAGFSHTHLSGTGCADLGDLLITPVPGSLTPGRQYRARFSHANERATPGYYSVRLTDTDILCELTASNRTGVHRYTFPRETTPRLVVNLISGQEDSPTDTRLTIVNDKLITGYRFSHGWANNQKFYFAARFSRPITRCQLFDTSNTARAGKEIRFANGCRAMLDFAGSSPNTLIVKVGISAVDEKGALKNLDQEVTGFDFDAVRAAARNSWNENLSRISGTSTDSSSLVVFYTALYHTMLAPTMYGDVDKRYRGADDKIHTSKRFTNYTTFSLWDTYRAAHPLYNLIMFDRATDQVLSMVAFARESGQMPIWPLMANETNCMVGYHSAAAIVDALLKDYVVGVPLKETYELLKKMAFSNYRGLGYYSMAPSPDALAVSKDPVPVPAGKVTVVNGFGTVLSGDSLAYHSSDPQVKLALINRADGHSPAMAWKTAPAPAAIGTDRVAYVWLAGISTGKGAHPFTVSVNGKKWFTFNALPNAKAKTFRVKGPSGSELLFNGSFKDEFEDLFGLMTMVLPASVVGPGEALTVNIEGVKQSTGDWCMMFKHAFTPRTVVANEFGISGEGAQRKQFVRVDIERLASAAPITIRSGAKVFASGMVAPGQNTYHFAIPAVSKDTVLALALEIAGEPSVDVDHVVKPAVPYGFIPADRENESVSKALEYAYDDYCVSLLAARMEDFNVARTLRERSGNWKNFYDPSTGFFRGRNSDGSWVTPFNPRYATGLQPEYTEGNAWQYLWLVPHDVLGLIEKVGGPAQFEKRLDSLFEQSSDLTGTGAPPDVSGLIGLYAHGNEPSHHIAYLYNAVGSHWKTQAYVNRIRKDFYTTGPEGLCGNEDCGQMSAWYIFSSLGLYPVNPVSENYYLGTPLLDTARVSLREGHTLTIVAHDRSPQNYYVQRVTFNGRDLMMPFVRYREIWKGGQLEFWLGPKPNTNWGKAPE